MTVPESRASSGRSCGGNRRPGFGQPAETADEVGGVSGTAGPSRPNSPDRRAQVDVDQRFKYGENPGHGACKEPRTSPVGLHAVPGERRLWVIGCLRPSRWSRTVSEEMRAMKLKPLGD